MPQTKTVGLFICLLISITSSTFCQVRKSVRSAGYGMPKVSRSKAIIMCPIFEESRYPYQGVGVKVGDPFALTYKFYPSKHWAFAADAGKASSGLYSSYYKNSFAAYLPDTLGKDQKVEYFTHLVNSDWFLEAKFLYQWDAEKISKGLQLYAGLGWQWRNSNIHYDYIRTTAKTNGNDGNSKFGQTNQNRFTYGPVAIVGFEYSYFTLPISAFIEVELFTDAFVDPGYQRFQGGVGLRYIF